MYKKNSANRQHREDWKVALSRLNVHGVDESAFKQGEELEKSLSRDELLLEKLKVEGHISQIKERIATAGRRAAATRNFMDPQAYQGLMDTKSSLIARHTQITIALKQQKLELAAKNTQQAAEERRLERQSFSRVFLEVAKEMLADAVFKRVITAAEHRFSMYREEDEKGA